MGSPPLSGLHRRYLELLEIDPEAPSLAHLQQLVRSHLQRIPFENISKLYYMRRLGFCGVPDLELYLDGIERYGFGGTCYSNNPHFHALLRALGYDAKLCGADMNEPDVHTALVVRLQGLEYHVDMGYAAPFDRPVPRIPGQDTEFRLGNESWIIRAPDEQDRTEVEHLREGETIHGYVLKPEPRAPDFFRPAVTSSYLPDSTFMTRLFAKRFGDGWSMALSDLSVIRAQGSKHEIVRLRHLDELIQLAEAELGIPPHITLEAAAAI